jgi:hypothetical protein
MAANFSSKGRQSSFSAMALQMLSISSMSSVHGAPLSK